MGSSNVKIPVAVCAVVGDVLMGSHKTLEILFTTAGVPGSPPDLAHHSKWKVWLQNAGNDPSVDSLTVLGNVIEEFMDLPPTKSETDAEFIERYWLGRERLETVLEEHGLRYFRGGRVLPVGTKPSDPLLSTVPATVQRPEDVEGLLKTLIRGLPRAMYPLTHRRKGSVALSFDEEYDIQDLLHSLMRPWIKDIRPEEYTPSYAGSSTRMDFLLPSHKLVLELKRVRDKAHSRKIGDELIIDIEHYRRHTQCESLWCVIYDPMNLLLNPAGTMADLEGTRSTPDGIVEVRVHVFGSG